MREMQENERVQKAKLILESKDGLNLDTDKVRAAAKYTSRGTGSIKARTKSRRVYNSKARAERISIDNKDVSSINPKDLLKKLFNFIGLK